MEADCSVVAPPEAHSSKDGQTRGWICGGIEKEQHSDVCIFSSASSCPPPTSLKTWRQKQLVLLLRQLIPDIDASPLMHMIMCFSQ